MSKEDLHKTNKYLETKVKKLQKLYVFNLIVILLLVFLITYKFWINDKVFYKKITTNQITVKDQQGRDRILISSDITKSQSRIRKDSLSGVLILDEDGNDRVVLGASPFIKTNQNSIIKRASKGPYGIVFNDENGVEKGGMGYYSDKGLSALGLDGVSGEGIVMFVPKEDLNGQKVGILINDPQKGGQLFYLGANTNGDKFLNIDTPGQGRFSVIQDSMFNNKVVKYNFKDGSQQIVLKDE
ncbi:hypothetical protein [Winogradskyella sp.]|uniref:hypothetical protein n=1 Tax=Winogradskyella sp. TaxID=1883156 RepID=UPI00262FC9C0|nr:hypothetical protein [Winogradskyella sp.]